MNGGRLNKGNRWAWGIVLLIIFFAATIRIRLLGLPLERDEGEYAYIGHLLLQGVPPFKLAYSMKFPGTAAAYALIMACFGQNAAGIHFGLLLINVATTVLVFLLGKKLLENQGALIACASYAIMSLSPAVMGLSAHATQFIVFFAMAGILLAWHAIEFKRLSLLFGSGLLFGLALLMKQPGFVFSIFGAFLIVWFAVKSWTEDKLSSFGWKHCLLQSGIFFLGVILPLVVVCLILFWAGVFDQFWFWGVARASTYGADLAVVRGVERLVAYFESDCGADILFWILAGLGLILTCFDLRKHNRKPIILVLLVTSMIAVCPGFYFRRHYFVLALPAISLLIGYGLDFLRSLIRQKNSSFVIQNLPAFAFIAVCTFVILSQREILFWDSPSVASHEMFGLENPFPESLEIGRFIRDHTDSTNQIAVMGSEPQIYFYAGRHSATGFIYTYDLMQPDSAATMMQRRMIQEIESARPAMLINVRLDFSWTQTEQSDETIFDWIEKYSSEHYDVAGVVNFFTNQPPEFHWGANSAKYLTARQFISVLKRKASH